MNSALGLTLYLTIFVTLSLVKAATYTDGIETVNVEPFPTLLSTLIPPPRSSANRLAIKRPKPVPFRIVLVESLTCSPQAILNTQHSQPSDLGYTEELAMLVVQRILDGQRQLQLLIDRKLVACEQIQHAKGRDVAGAECPRQYRGLAEVAIV